MEKESLEASTIEEVRKWAHIYTGEHEKSMRVISKLRTAHDFHKSQYTGWKKILAYLKNVINVPSPQVSDDEI